MPTNRVTICQDKDVYRYNSDTILLYGFIWELSLEGKILDVGFGSGILTLLIKRDNKKCDVFGVDIQKRNLTLALHNAKQNALEVAFENIDFQEFRGRGFDTIVSNPPFYHKDVQKTHNEHMAKSRYSTYLPLEVFIKKAYTSLKDRGRLVFCYDAKQTVGLLETLHVNRLTPEIVQFVHTKKEKEASIVMILARKNSKALLRVLPPCILHDESGEYTKEAKRRYNIANVESQEWTI